jgi:hypothetical protein
MSSLKKEENTCSVNYSCEFVFNKLNSPQVSGQQYFLSLGCNPIWPLNFVISVGIAISSITASLFAFIFQFKFP